MSFTRVPGLLATYADILHSAARIIDSGEEEDAVKERYKKMLPGII
jgi:hypothetical protein